MAISSQAPQPGDELAELVSADVAVTVNVSNGAKITSLLDRASQREWLLQPAVATATVASAPAGYGSVFTDQPLAGWDEMFPTVDACRLSDGVELPDHGEVWSRPWTVREAGPAVVACDIDGVALDYRLSRRIEVSGPVVTLRYRVETRQEAGLAVLWAAHPQCVVRPGTMLELPAGAGPLTARPEGTTGQFRQVGIGRAGLDWRQVAGPGQGTMLYADSAGVVGQIRLADPDGPWLAMTWDSQQVRYFAIWVDNGRYAQVPVVCPEPMSGYYDSLRRARDNDRVLTVTASAPAGWTVQLTVGRR